MKRPALILLILLTLATLLSAQGYKVEKNLTVASEESLSENILSWKGKVAINGRLRESIFMAGGELVLKGVVDKDVICIGTRVTLMENSVIKGELLLIGGTQTRRSGARIDGGHFHFHYDWKSLRSSLHPIISGQRSAGFFRAAKVIVWFVIALLTFVLFPVKILSADRMIAERGWRMGIAGILSLLAFVVLFFVSLILSFFLIGIPLLFLLIVAYFAIIVFGRTALMYFLGGRILKLFGRTSSATSWILLTGAMVFAVLNFIPFFGAVILLLFNLVEIGIGTAFLLRLRPFSHRNR